MTTRRMRPAPPPYRRLWLLTLVAIAVSSLPLGCGRAGGHRKIPGYLQVDIETSPLSIDPRFATDAISSRISELVFDSLVRLDEHGRFVGNLAESIERPSPSELLFHLRHDARFSDGRPLTARDVKYTYDFVTDPANLSPKHLEEIKSVRALDDYTVEITTQRPYAPAIGSAMLGVVPYGAAGGGAGAAGPPGSGPFRLAAFVRDEMLVLDRNRFASNPASALRGLIFKIVPDPTVRALELAEGICDFTENDVEPYLLGYLSARSELNIVRSPGTAYRYIAFNFRDPRLRDIRVRRAIAYAIDRQSLVASMLRGTARLASGMLTPENWAYEGEVTRYPYDPAAAKRLLDEAGYRAGADGMRPLSLVFKTTVEGQRLGEALQAMLKLVGIALSVRTNEFATFYSDVQQGNFDLMSMQWVGINDPHQYYMVFDSKMTPPRGSNRGWYSSPEMDALVEEGDVSLDPALRRAAYAKVQKLAADELPYVSLWWQDNVAVMTRRLSGFTPFPNGSLRSLATVRLEGGALPIARGGDLGE